MKCGHLDVGTACVILAPERRTGNAMKRLCLMLGLAILTMGAAHAQTSQQNRMAACNDAAKTRQLAGDPRKAFMSQCLSSGVPAEPAPQLTQQQRMKDCNAAAGAGGYKGDARQAFMSDCLKGGKTTAGGKQTACTADADSRKLAGAARTSFLTKCNAS